MEQWPDLSYLTQLPELMLALRYVLPNQRCGNFVSKHFNAKALFLWLRSSEILAYKTNCLGLKDKKLQKCLKNV